MANVVLKTVFWPRSDEVTGQLRKMHCENFLISTRQHVLGTAVAQWLRCCATNRKVAGPIPDGVIGIFH